MNESILANELINKPISDPKIDPTKDGKLQVVLPQQLMTRLNYLSEASGINKAEFARRILVEWFEESYEEKMRFWEQVN